MAASGSAQTSAAWVVTQPLLILMARDALDVPGHVFITSQNVEHNVTDLLGATAANKLFAAQAKNLKTRGSAAATVRRQR